MSNEEEKPEAPSSRQASQVWERIAAWWDRSIGEGNEFQRELIMPASDRLLAIKPGELVLDIACGNGNYARRLARGGAKVIGFDASPTFIKRAREISGSEGLAIEYRVLDATDEEAMIGLGDGRFDAAVCSMAVMDLPAITPLLRAVRRLLKPGGRFVFSVPHPCFNSSKLRLTAEMIEEEGKLSQVFGVHISEYLRSTTYLSTGIINQPEPHYLFHRSLATLLGECFAAGFVVDSLEEPAFAPGSNAKNPFSWAKRPDIPPAIVVRIRTA